VPLRCTRDALVNSVTAEDEFVSPLHEIPGPMVARHDAAVIGLCNDEHCGSRRRRRSDCGMPADHQRRGDHEIAAEDVVIDPLAIPSGADTEASTTTLATISGLICDELG